MAFLTQINNQPRIFNVRLYGAKGDGVTDDTVAIQAAIQACYDAHGGVVFFPNGTYIIAGSIQTSIGGIDMNSQIYIPLNTTPANISTIELMGEAPASPGNSSISSPYDPGGFANQGVTLYSTYTGTRSTVNKGTSIIGTGAVNANSFNSNTVNITNINFIAKGNPNGAGPEIGGFNGKFLVGFNVDYCSYKLDIPMSSGVLPTRDISGFESPENSGGASYSFTNTSVTGLKWGYIFGEHVFGYQNSASGCYYGFGMKPGHHSSSFSRTNAYWCISGISYYPYAKDATLLAKFNMYAFDMEWSNNTYPGKYYTLTLYGVDDPSNKLVANINYTVVEAGVGINNGLWAMNGASGVKAVVLGASIGAAGSNKQVQFNSSGSLAGSANMIWDSPTNRFIVGGATAAGFDINAIGSAALVGISAQSTNAAGQSLLFIENNRGSSVSYTAIIYGGSTTAAGNLFGVNRVDKAFFITDGANNLGMYMGTLQAQPLVLGTNNTAVMTIASGGNIAVTGGSGNDMVSITGSGSSGNVLHLIGSNAAGQISTYLENNRGSFASYGGLLYGGSTNAIGNLFGVSRADKLFIIADGASNLGMYLGTLQAQPLVFGTNNTTIITIASSGQTTIGASEAHAYRAITALRTLDATDYMVNCTANSFTVTLPTAVGITGRQYIIKNTGSSTTITIATTSSQTVDGTTPGTVTTLAPYRVMSDGANWITW